MNNQSHPGGEANLDVQFALGISFPTPGTFYRTGRRAPFKPDQDTTINTNEPYKHGTYAPFISTVSSCTFQLRQVAGLYSCTIENSSDHIY